MFVMSIMWRAISCTGTTFVFHLLQGSQEELHIFTSFHKYETQKQVQLETRPVFEGDSKT